MSKEQKQELITVLDNLKSCSCLDYVSCWYQKAVEYMQGTQIKAAFVSTNSITQGEQVPVLWPHLFNLGLKINFAHQTFKWSNEAARGQGMAAVYCVIIGFALSDNAEEGKRLFRYADIAGDSVASPVKEINAYLQDAPAIFIEARSKPLCSVSEMKKGCSPIDDGALILSPDERDAIIAGTPESAAFIRPYMSADDFLNSVWTKTYKRYCLWLKDVEPAQYRKCKPIADRVAHVKAFREASNREATLKRAAFPALFAENRQPETDYILIPRHSSERRQYIPIGFLKADIIASDSCMTVANATLYEFGVMTSALHMAWMRTVCGRLKSDYRYSNDIVYNNFPWPTAIDKQKTAIEKAAQAVLDARAAHPDSTLADLYDPLAMPATLTKAHQTLDKAVDAAYNRKFASDSERVAWLFELYQQKAGELFTTTQKKGKGRKVKAATKPNKEQEQ
jgi:hypothetical protein